MTWSSGYETGVEYTFGYYRDMAPPMLRFSLLLSGVRPPTMGRYLELGAGRGLSLNIHAAGNAVAGVATDFIPSHAVDALDLAQGSGAAIFEDSFAETIERLKSGELAPFDVIAFHGVYSWVSEERRKEIRELCRLGLAPGGVVYNSYNAMPGWAPALPLQRLFRMYAQGLSITTDPIAQRTKEAVILARQMQEGGAAYNAANPNIVHRLNSLHEHMLNYVVHEYQHQQWECFYFMDVAEGLASDCKLDFACSASLLDAIEAVSTPPAAKAMLAEIASPLMREQVRDYWVNTSFRRDLYARGAPRLPHGLQQQMLADTYVVATEKRSSLVEEMRGPAGIFKLDPDSYGRVADAACEQGKPVRIGELVKLTGLSWSVTVGVVAVLVAAGFLSPCAEDHANGKQRARCKALNKIIRERARHDNAITYLASPVIGAGVAVGRFEQLFVSAIEAGQKTPQAWAEHAHAALASAGQAVTHEGKVLAERDESVAHLASLARTFEQDKLPVLRPLGVV